MENFSYNIIIINLHLAARGVFKEGVGVEDGTPLLSIVTLPPSTHPVANLLHVRGSWRREGGGGERGDQTRSSNI